MPTGPSRPRSPARSHPRRTTGLHRRRLLVAGGLFLLVAAVGSCAGEPRPAEPTALDLAAASGAGTSSTAPATTERPATTEPAATEPPATTTAPATTRPKPKATTPPTTRRRATTTTRPAAGDCHPSYSGACLHDGIGDYDCAGGSGNGPNYVAGPIRVRGADPFDLDRDGDGVACEG